MSFNNTEMKTEVWAFILSRQTGGNDKEGFSKPDPAVQVLLSGLQSMYSEVFVWSVNNHLAFWVSGADVNKLIDVVFENMDHFDKIQLLRGKKAQDYLWAIANGLSWQDCHAVEKLAAFKESYLYAHIHGQLGAELAPVVECCLNALMSNPWVASAGYSWTRPRSLGRSILKTCGIAPDTREMLLSPNLN